MNERQWQIVQVALLHFRLHPDDWCDEDVPPPTGEELDQLIETLDQGLPRRDADA
jgi:hypothetical protein